MFNKNKFLTFPFAPAQVLPTFSSKSSQRLARGHSAPHNKYMYIQKALPL